MIWLNVRHALRLLRGSPGFATIAVLTLALGIGANTAVFSVVDAVMLEPLPYPAPEQLVSLWELETTRGRSNVSPANLVDYARESSSFAGLTGYSFVSRSLTGQGVPDQILGEAVTANNFAVRGVHPRLGREFLPEEDRPGRDRVVIVTDAFWRSHLGADPQVLGRDLILDGRPHNIVGVMPPGSCACAMDFRATPAIAFLKPAAYTNRQLTDHGSHEINVVGRLKSGVRIGEAQADLDAIMKGLAERFPEEAGRYRVRLVPLHDDLVRDVRRSMIVMLGAVGLVLIIASVNVANLLLVRALGQRREMSIRRALGATRTHILVDSLTRSLVVALAGGLAGLLVGVWTRDVLVAMAPSTIPRLYSVGVNARVLGATLALSLASGVFAGLLPAWHAAREESASLLNTGETTAASRQSLTRWRGLLMAAEIAAALTLAVAAGLLVRSLIALNGVALGFQTTQVLTLRITLPPSRYPDAGARFTFFDALARRVAGLPGVASAAFANQFPMRGEWGGGLTLQLPSGPAEVEAGFQAVSPPYFSTLGMSLIRGRGISVDDRLGAPAVAVVSRTFVDRYIGGIDPIGRQFTRGPLPPEAVGGVSVDRNGPGQEPLVYTIVGIVDDIRRGGKASHIEPQVYLSAAQTDHYPVRLADFAVRAIGNPTTLVPAIQHEVWQLDQDQPVTNVRTLDEVIALSQAERRFILGLLSSFAGLALGLALIGVYGVVAYGAAQRTRELAVRVALGASSRDIVTLVVQSGVAFALVGVAVGMAGAYLVSRLLTTLLFGITATDPMTFVVVAALMMGLAVMASYIPARRAATVDPAIALRSE